MTLILAAPPVPFNATLVVPVQLLVMTSVAETRVAFVGVNPTGIVACCVGLRLIGSGTEPSENTVPPGVIDNAVIVTAVEPEFVTTTFWVVVWPIVAPLKFTAPGLTDRAH